MPTTLALRHVAFEDLGTLEPLLQARGHDITYLDAGVDPLDDETLMAPDLLVVLGGPIGVYETDRYPFLTEEIAAVAHRLSLERPTIGLCLGAQIMAAALGASVYAGPKGKEIGFAPVELTEAGLTSPLAPLAGSQGNAPPVLHWHGDTYDLPDGAIHLARTDKYEQQAFSIGSHALGVQFHPEADGSRIERWLIGHAVEIAHSEDNIEGGIHGIREQAAIHASTMMQLSFQCFGAWAEAAGV